MNLYELLEVIGKHTFSSERKYNIIFFHYYVVPQISLIEESMLNEKFSHNLEIML